jgi:hypothetical protein
MAAVRAGPVLIALTTTGDMSAWQQQQLDDLRQRLADHLQRRGELADADAVRRIDDEIAEQCTSIADIERQLKKATP